MMPIDNQLHEVRKCRQIIVVLLHTIYNVTGNIVLLKKVKIIDYYTDKKYGNIRSLT